MDANYARASTAANGRWRAPLRWIQGERRVRWARRILYAAMACGIGIVVLVSRADRGYALSLASELVLAILTANLALVLWEVRELSRGLGDVGLDRSAPAQMQLAKSIRRLVGVLVVMLVSGTGLMLWAHRLLPQDATGEFALLFWVLLASGFALSIYVAELITHLIHAFEAALLQLAGNNAANEQETATDTLRKKQRQQAVQQ